MSELLNIEKETTYPATFEDIMKQMLRKNDSGNYICPEEEGARLANALNKMIGKSSTEDADFEIISETNPHTTMNK